MLNVRGLVKQSFHLSRKHLTQETDVYHCSGILVANIYDPRMSRAVFRLTREFYRNFDQLCMKMCDGKKGFL